MRLRPVVAVGYLVGSLVAASSHAMDFEIVAAAFGSSAHVSPDRSALGIVTANA